MPQSEPLQRQALIPKLGVEGFIVTVLPRITGFDVCGVNVRLGEPLQDLPGDELRAVVHTER